MIKGTISIGLKTSNHPFSNFLGNFIFIVLFIFYLHDSETNILLKSTLFHVNKLVVKLVIKAQFLKTENLRKESRFLTC